MTGSPGPSTDPPAPRVSVVVPAYNEAARIPASLDRLRSAAPTLGIREIIVVDDGSTDGTAALVASAITDADASEAQPPPEAGATPPTEAHGSGEARPPSEAGAAPALRLIRLPANRGKGAAVRAGVAEAVGDYVVFLDADLSAPPDDIPRAVAAIEAGADVVIGSRVTPTGADARSTQPFRRRLTGRVFAGLQRIITGLPYVDTQCPFKLFTRDAAARLFPITQTSGWSFDVELLVRARRLGMTIEEFPVEWRHVGGSHIRIGPLTALRVLGELVSIRRRVGRGAP